MKPKPKKQTKREWKEWRLVDGSDGDVYTFTYSTKARAKESCNYFNDYKPGPHRIIRVSVKEL